MQAELAQAASRADAATAECGSLRSRMTQLEAQLVGIRGLLGRAVWVLAVKGWGVQRLALWRTQGPCGSGWGGPKLASRLGGSRSECDVRAGRRRAAGRGTRGQGAGRDRRGGGGACGHGGAGALAAAAAGETAAPCVACGAPAPRRLRLPSGTASSRPLLLCVLPRVCHVPCRPAGGGGAAGPCARRQRAAGSGGAAAANAGAWSGPSRAWWGKQA